MEEDATGTQPDSSPIHLTESDGEVPTTLANLQMEIQVCILFFCMVGSIVVNRLINPDYVYIALVTLGIGSVLLTYAMVKFIRVVNGPRGSKKLESK